MTTETSTSPVTATGQRPANTQRQYRVKRSDLPLSCPTPEMVLWNSHPRVYLAIESTGKSMCPYCGANFLLED